MLPNQVLFSLWIEAALVLFTLFLLLQPAPVFARQSARLRRAAWVSGMTMLCLTFCWSVILGAILTLYRSFQL